MFGFRFIALTVKLSVFLLFLLIGTSHLEWTSNADGGLANARLSVNFHFPQSQQTYTVTPHRPFRTAYSSPQHQNTIVETLRLALSRRYGIDGLYSVGSITKGATQLFSVSIHHSDSQFTKNRLAQGFPSNTPFD